ncbi:hypothetical protein PR202_gb02124 [Eleusine coracana subsp. coracana]|uniref:Uncharacterized protein n=1 Tax=Eleusine coracana subsp. coracana TaxID=191504 RepID=A0AAV5DXX1_ELECO|nr:hypothetical protein PR202_gb02124 [Eleusine coracana subsp. coracana]
MEPSAGADPDPGGDLQLRHGEPGARRDPAHPAAAQRARPRRRRQRLLLVPEPKVPHQAQAPRRRPAPAVGPRLPHARRNGARHAAAAQPAPAGGGAHLVVVFLLRPVLRLVEQVGDEAAASRRRDSGGRIPAGDGHGLPHAAAISGRAPALLPQPDCCAAAAAADCSPHDAGVDDDHVPRPAPPAAVAAEPSVVHAGDDRARRPVRSRAAGHAHALPSRLAQRAARLVQRSTRAGGLRRQHQQLQLQQGTWAWAWASVLEQLQQRRAERQDRRRGERGDQGRREGRAGVTPALRLRRHHRCCRHFRRAPCRSSECRQRCWQYGGHASKRCCCFPDEQRCCCRAQRRTHRSAARYVCLCPMHPLNCMCSSKALLQTSAHHACRLLVCFQIFVWFSNASSLVHVFVRILRLACLDLLRFNSNHCLCRELGMDGETESTCHFDDRSACIERGAVSFCARLAVHGWGWLDGSRLSHAWCTGQRDKVRRAACKISCTRCTDLVMPSVMSVCCRYSGSVEVDVPCVQITY